MLIFGALCGSISVVVCAAAPDANHGVTRDESGGARGLGSVKHDFVAFGSRVDRPLLAASWMRTRDVKASLLVVLNSVLDTKHHNNVQEEVASIEDVLRPMYRSLPKNRYRLLGHSAVRYALHRYFVGQHAMYVKGLEPAVDDWSTAGSPVSIIEDRVPSFVHGLFEDGLREGFSLNDLAVLVAAFQHLVRDDARHRLASILKLKAFSPKQDLTIDEGKDAIELYMMSYLLGDHFVSSNGNHSTIDQVLPTWQQIRDFALDVWKETLRKSERSSDRSTQESIVGSRLISLSTVDETVQAVGERFGQFQNRDCLTMKHRLVEYEENGTGRVSLASFYKAGSQEFRFSEKEATLRSAGVLDESLVGRPRVIIPNYLTSNLNCIATASMYSLCCIDECEELMGGLESRLGEADGTPEEIAKIIADLPSSTVNAPRTLDISLVRRLEDIASRHGGRVKLHGRLFARWLHRAYPRECAVPPGNVSLPRTADEWLLHDRSAQDGVVRLSEEEIEVLVAEDVKSRNIIELGIVLRGLATIALLFALTNAGLRILGSAFRNPKLKL